MLGTTNSFHIRCNGVERHKIHFTDFFLRGATAQIGPRTPRFEVFRSHKIIHARTHPRARARPVGLLSTFVSLSQRPLLTEHTTNTGDVDACCS